MSTTNLAFDPREFRRALGNFACGVTIVTACDPDGQKVGVTANSFNSVSLDPALILWSLDKRSSAWETFLRASHFCVNILAYDQIELSNHFARPQEDKFRGIPHLSGLGRAPLFEGCAGNFQCSHFQHIDAGDHWILIGKVEAFEDFSRAPLAYHQGSYAIVLPHPRGKHPEPQASDDKNDDLLQTKLGENLFYLMIQAANASHPRFVQQHLALGMRNSESRLLMVLDSAPNASLPELQQAVSMPSREVEEALGTLQKKGLITRQDDNRIAVTNEGHAMLEHLWETVREAQNALFSELNEGEMQVFKKALKLALSGN